MTNDLRPVPSPLSTINSQDHQLSPAGTWLAVFCLLSSVLCGLFLAACSPSLDDAKQALQQQIASQSQGHIKLVSFKTTDIQEFQTGGVPERRISFTAELEFEENGLWTRGLGNQCLDFEFTPNPRTADGDSTPNPHKTEAIADQMLKDLQGQRQMTKGDRVKIAGVLTGTKSANGWRYEPTESRLAGE